MLASPRCLPGTVLLAQHMALMNRTTVGLSPYLDGCEPCGIVRNDTPVTAGRLADKWNQERSIQ